jgi:hypothetical protein
VFSESCHGDVIDVGAAAAQELDLLRVDVDAERREAAGGEGQRERQSDITQADDPYGRGV